MATSAFNAPTIMGIAALGVNALNASGFELLPGGKAFAVLNIDVKGSLTTGCVSRRSGHRRGDDAR